MEQELIKEIVRYIVAEMVGFEFELAKEDTESRELLTKVVPYLDDKQFIIECLKAEKDIYK